MMRAEKTIRIGGDGEAGRDVVVYELTVSQMGDALSLLSMFVGGGQGLDSLTAIAAAELGRSDGASKRLLHQISSLKEEIDELGGVALMDVIEAWTEVNTAFFVRIGEMNAKRLKPQDENAGQTKTPKKQAA
jgi:hypothetical protein